MTNCCDKCGLANMVQIGNTLECPICGFAIVPGFDDLSELITHLNEWDRWNADFEDDPDGSLAEAQLKEDNAIWESERGVH